jgi:hypothetical protein
MAVNWEELRRPVPKEALQFRPGTRNRERTRAMVLAYIDANYVADLLDSVVGPENWRLPEPVEVTLNGIPAVKRALVIRVDGEWIEKWEYGYPNSIRDGAVQDEAPLKSAASDALKRCAWMWGVGRELRRSPHLWWDLDEWGRFTDAERLAEEYWRRATGRGPSDEEPVGDEPELTSPMGLCPVHRIPFVHKVGTRRDGSTYDFWGCPRKNPDGSWCRERPTVRPEEPRLIEMEEGGSGAGEEPTEDLDGGIEARLIGLGATTKAKQNSRYGRWAHQAGVTPMTATWRDLTPGQKAEFRDWLEEQPVRSASS